jgi:hypothetical protein
VILTSGSCKISGVPTVLQDTATYTIKATNLVKPETLPLALDTCTEGVLPKLDALISFWE